MDKKKLLTIGLRGLTVAGFLAASTLPQLSFAGEEATPGKEPKKMEGKKGSCSGKGSCGAMKDEKKEAKEADTKKGSCSGMKDKGEKKEEGKKGSCTAMK